MLDIGWQELFIVAILAIIVVGPKDLPRAIRGVMRGIGKVKAMSREFQSGLDDVAREADLMDLKAEAERAARMDFTEEIKKTVDPDGELEREADIDRDVRKTMADVKHDAAEATEKVAAEAAEESRQSKQASG